MYASQAVRDNVRVERERRRVVGRGQAEMLLERAAYLPLAERLLVEQSVGQGQTIDELAVLARIPVPRLRRKLGCLRRRLADPCFLLATRYAERLPAAVRPVARSLYVDGLTLRQCARRHHLTLHGVRQALAAARALLMLSRTLEPVAAPHPSVEVALPDDDVSDEFQDDVRDE